MTFDDDYGALTYARENGLRIDYGEFTDYGYEVQFTGSTSTRQEAVVDWEEQQLYWGVCATTSNGSIMYKRDVAKVALATGMKKKDIKDVTFNRHEALLLNKKQATNKAYYLTRNGHYNWKAERLVF